LVGLKAGRERYEQVSERSWAELQAVFINLNKKLFRSARNFAGKPGGLGGIYIKKKKKKRRSINDEVKKAEKSSTLMFCLRNMKGKRMAQKGGK